MNTNVGCSAAILHLTQHMFLWVNTLLLILSLRGKGGMNRMRVGCSLKTKDGLLDIWTSTPDYIKLYLPMLIFSNGFKALVCLCIIESRNTEWASVSICETFYGREEINQKLTSASEILQKNLQTINSNMEGEMIWDVWSRCLSLFTRNCCSYILLSLFSHFSPFNFHSYCSKWASYTTNIHLSFAIRLPIATRLIH